MLSGNGGRAIGILLTVAGGSSHSGATCEPVYPAKGHIAEMSRVRSSTVGHTVSCQPSNRSYG